MRPGKYDRKHEFLIQGAELRELKELDLPESFGLDRRIERYQWGERDEIEDLELVPATQ
jgi:hypothetical protein